MSLKITPDEVSKDEAARPPLSPHELRQFKAQLVAVSLDIPRVCRVRRCRKLRKCIYAGAPCLREHWDHASDRFARLVWEE